MEGLVVYVYFRCEYPCFQAQILLTIIKLHFYRTLASFLVH